MIESWLVSLHQLRSAVLIRYWQDTNNLIARYKQPCQPPLCPAYIVSLHFAPPTLPASTLLRPHCFPLLPPSLFSQMLSFTGFHG